MSDERTTNDARTKTCPECFREVHHFAAQCYHSDCHAYFDKNAQIWFQRDKILERSRLAAEQARKDAEEKERKKKERAAAKAKAKG